MSDHDLNPSIANKQEIPVGNASGFIKYIKYDFVSGFLVFLIALPLCLGIALACGYPAIAGIFTAIIGSILTTLISNSELTIKGPAAGLIVIAIGCVNGFGGEGFATELSPEEFDVAMTAYRMALAVGVVAAVLQIFFGLFHAGILGEFFPLSAVHGMLAAIGVIIMVKQVPAALGVIDKELLKGEPLELITKIPEFFEHMNPEIALIGGVGLAIMFAWPYLQNLHHVLKTVPAAMVVLVTTVPMGMYFDLLHKHTYSFHGHRYEVGEAFLVNMPDRVFGIFDYIQTPDFSAFTGEHQMHALTYVFLFFVIGSLESLLSAKAVDVIDPWKRKTNLDRDIVAVGAGNLACALVGGLPMISEIVRSKANIDNGARTRFADMWHGVFLLLCVALIPTVLHHIPIAALAAMLIYTGFRLTHPNEFLHVYEVGKEQLLIFIATLVGVLATDLLIGILIGMGAKILLHLLNGVPLRSLFKSYLDIEVKGDTAIVRARYSAIFTNWILFRRQLVRLGLVERKNVIVDLSQVKLVDHSVMEKLHELERDFETNGVKLEVCGLEGHKQLSGHELAARKRGLTQLRRVTIVASDGLEETLVGKMMELGASGYTAIPCHGVGRTSLVEGNDGSNSQVRLEAVVTREVAERVLDYLRMDVLPSHRATVCMETVEVLRQNDF